MTIIPDGYGQATLTFNNGGAPRPAQVTFGFQNETDMSAIDAAEAIGDAALADLMAAVCTTDVLVKNVHVKLGPVADGDFADFAVSIAGNQASDTPPTQSCLNVIKQTAFGGRRGRGRFFWPGYPESVLEDSGSFGSAALAQFDDAFEDWREAMDVLGLKLVLLHQSGVSTPFAITRLSVRSRTVTQRRRNRGV